MSEGDSEFKGLVEGLLDVAIPTFGETVEYRPKSGGKFLIQAVFDENFEQIDPDTETIVSVVTPRIGVKLASIPGYPEPDDEVRINQRFFKVNEIHEDGQGGAAIWLTAKDDN